MLKTIGLTGLVIAAVCAADTNNNDNTHLSESNQLKRRLLGYPANDKSGNKPGYIDIADDKYKKDQKDEYNFWEFERNNNYEQDQKNKKDDENKYSPKNDYEDGDKEDYKAYNADKYDGKKYWENTDKSWDNKKYDDDKDGKKYPEKYGSWENKKDDKQHYKGGYGYNANYGMKKDDDYKDKSWDKDDKDKYYRNNKWNKDYNDKDGKKYPEKYGKWENKKDEKNNYRGGYSANYRMKKDDDKNNYKSWDKDNKDYRNNEWNKDKTYGWDKDDKDYDNKDRKDSYKGYKSVKKDDNKNDGYYRQKYANYKVGKHDNNKDNKYEDGDKNKKFAPYHANSAVWYDNNNNNNEYHQSHVKEAIAILNVGDGSGVTGYVKFEETGYGNVKITAKISGLKPGLHGWHIHELGDIYTNACLSTGGHYNPLNNDHGAPRNDIDNRHIGDLGNIDVGYDGVAYIEQYDNIISLNGPHSIIGRGIVIHEDEDDLGLAGDEGSLTTGNAGDRPACGVIGIKTEEEQDYHHQY